MVEEWDQAVSRAGQRPLARRFAEALCALDYRDLGQPAIDNAKMLLASTVASSALGTTIDTAQMVGNVISERAGHQASSWFESGAKASLPDAVRLNAIRSSAAASDDSDLRNLLHAGTAVTTAAIATGEFRGRDGKDTLAAIVLGYEAAARIGAAITPGFRHRGFHGCIAAIFGAAVATSRLLELDPPRMTHAIALAATTVSGLLRSAEMSNAREHQDSMAATLGVEVALAAEQGFTADEWVLEGVQGYFDVYGGTSAAVGEAALLGDLGESWALLTSMAIKLVPGGHPFHAAAEASLSAVTQLGVDADQIRTLRVAAPGLQSLRGPRHPTTLLEMAHSQAYFVAAAAVDRQFSWAHATPNKINDPAIHHMIERVEVDTNLLVDREQYRLGTAVTAVACDGRSVHAAVFEPNGSAARGLRWADVDDKFRALTPIAKMDASSIELALQVIHALDAQSDLTPLVDTLSAEPASERTG